MKFGRIIVREFGRIIVLETNDRKNLTTGFSENKTNPLFNAGLLPAVLPW